MAALPNSITERLLDKKATFQSLNLGLDRRITKGLSLLGFVYPTLVQVRGGAGGAVRVCMCVCVCVCV